MNNESIQALLTDSLDKECQIQYREFLPSTHLRSHIACYSSAVSTTVIETPFPHRIIPDGCTNLIFDLNNPSGRFGFVTGPLTEAQSVPFVNQVQLVGIRFYPGSAPLFFDGHVQAPSNQTAPLAAISGDADDRMISEQLAEEHSLEKKIAIVDKYIAGHLEENKEIDPILMGALEIIYQHRGDIGISCLAKQLQISQRQLNRKFDTWIGMSPKTFCRIIRFQNVLKILSTASSDDLLSIALDSGYYDQSHFIHEFNSLCGLSPFTYKTSLV